MLESNINLALIDPAKWGWSAGGKVVQLLTPHEDLRRRRRKARGGGMAAKSRRTLTSASSSMSDSGKSPGLAQLFDLDGDNTCDTGGTNINSMSNSKSNRSSSRSNKKRPNLRMKQPQPQQPQQSLPVEDTPRKATTACSSQHPTSPVATPSTITPTPTIPFPHHSGMSTSGAPSPLVLLQKQQQQQQQLTIKTSEESSPEQPSPESSLLPRESTTRSAVTVTSTATTIPAANTTTVTTPSMEQISLDFKSVEIRQGKPNELIVNALVSNNATTTMTSTNKESDETNDTTKFVDVYTYHLGREGLELCDEPDPVDTGCNAPLPRTKFPIQVEFPLDDDRTEMWTEQIEWDLEDEKTLTPMAFATQVAHDFGLNFGDTMELASSIQEQLNAFRAAESSSYPDPQISLNDPSTGLPRSTLPPNKSKPCYLYGWTDGSDLGGMPMVIKKAPRPPATPTATIAAPAPVAAAAAAASIVSTSSTKVSTTKTSERSVNSNKPRSEDLGYQFKTPIAFREEVIKRAKLECQFPSRNLQLKWNHVCHLCDTKKQQGAMLPCENPLHIYCLEHAKSELKIDLSVPGRATTTPVDYCPICCCSCSCRTCQKRLDQVAYELQRRSVANGGTSPQDTKLDQILLYCAGKLQPNRRKSSGSTTGAGGGKGYIDKLKVVPKAPLSDFPMEMCGSRNMEPGSEMDYRTVFTQNGAFLLEPDDPILAAAAIEATKTTSLVAAASSVAVVTEDGNVDYCQICQKAGNIVCCDYCPRAFHAACMKDGEAAIHNSNANGSNSVDDGGSSRWECPTCIQEKERLPQDVITGRAKFENDQGSDKDCLAVVCEAFAAAGGSHAEDDIRAMKVLSILLEMVQHLMDYDFGYMFQEPVDIQAIPEYATVVKQPMDLGTLADRLADGYYAKLFDPETKDWNRVIAQVLMDVELVWHNCFTFNFEGSAIFRMAEVCLRRARNIVASTLEPLVDDAVKVEVATYVKACERERAPMSSLSSSSFHIIPKSKHRIRVAWAPGGKCRVIAVLDPDTGRLVKLYSTMKSAWTAAYYLHSLGHATEWPSISDYTIRNCIKRCKDEPTLTLFGYRWLYFDELRSGKVAFGQQVVNPNDNDWLLRQPDDCFIQMTDCAGVHYLFLSIAEAISFYGLPKDAPLADLKTRLETSPMNEWIPLVGLKWCKLPKNTAATSSSSSGKPPPPPMPSSSSSGAGQTRMATTPMMIMGTQRGGSSGSTSKEHAAVVKQDILSGRRLIGFDSIEAAFLDWKSACLGSPVASSKLDLSMEVFKKHFLNGDRTVDGLAWKSTTRASNEVGSKNEKPKPHDSMVIMETEEAGKRRHEDVNDDNPSPTKKNVPSTSEARASITLPNDGKAAYPPSETISEPLK